MFRKCLIAIGAVVLCIATLYAEPEEAVLRAAAWVLSSRARGLLRSVIYWKQSVERTLIYGRQCGRPPCESML
jgi:hypothetical protein